MLKSPLNLVRVTAPAYFKTIIIYIYIYIYMEGGGERNLKVLRSMFNCNTRLTASEKYFENYSLTIVSSVLFQIINLFV